MPNCLFEKVEFWRSILKKYVGGGVWKITSLAKAGGMGVIWAEAFR